MDWMAILKDVAENVPTALAYLQVHHPVAVTTMLGEGTDAAENARARALARKDGEG